MSTPQPSEKGAETADTALGRGADTQPRPTPKDDAGTDTLHAAGAPPVRSASEIGRGSTLGRYIVLDRLGAGGMGVVFAAFDPELDRKVAIKVLQATSRSSRATAGRVRLLREAQAMAKLSHPNVIPVYDVGTLGHNVFLAMEFIAGNTLRAWVEAQRDAKAFEWREALRLYAQAGKGLAAAHSAGIVHRDFKPENVMVDNDARARVLDFGLARPARDSSVSSLGDDEADEYASGTFEMRLTATGAVMGTPFYMAPEQHRGGVVDERADQFSFCVALWEALYDERPFKGSSLPELARTVTQGEIREPPKGSGIPQWVRRVLERGLATDPDDRFATMEDLLAELGRDPAARRRVLGIAAGLVLVPTLAVGGVLLLSGSRRPCKDLDEGIDRVWGGAQQQEVRDAFDPLDDADGPAAFKRIAASLDAYAQAWAEGRTEACEATRLRNDQSEQVLELRYACLDTRVHRLEALVEVLARADKEIVFRAPALVAELPLIRDCADVPALRKQVAPPADSEARKRVEEIRRRLAKAQALAVTGHLDEVSAELNDLLIAARASGYPPIEGDVLLLWGHLKRFSGENAAAYDATRGAELIAQASGYDGLLVSALLKLAALDGLVSNEFERAHQNVARARAVVARMGNPSDYRGQAHLTAGRIFRVQRMHKEAAAEFETFLGIMREAGREEEPVALETLGAFGHELSALDRPEEAEQAIVKALERGRELLGRNHPEIATVAVYHARLLSDRDRVDESLLAFEEAREIMATAYGPHHGNVGAVLNDEASVLTDAGRFEEALEKYQRAEPIIVGMYGEENIQHAVLMLNSALLMLRTGRPEEAFARAKRAVGVRGEHFGKNTIPYAKSLDVLGDAAVALSRRDEARTAFRSALAIYTVTHGEDHYAIATPELGLGDLDLADGDLVEARQHFERALEVSKSEEDVGHLIGRAKFGLARVQVARGDEGEAAFELAKEAKVAFAEHGWTAAHIKQVDDWLDEHSP